jgi:multidrug efflux pump subunit AcrA (membrane-fusion protein)
MAVARAPRRALVLVGIAAALGAAFGVWKLHARPARAAAQLPFVKASVDDVIVSVGGVGRIIEGRRTGEIPLPATSSSGAGTASGAVSTAPADSVFPHTAGRLAEFLVVPGQHVKIGQPLAKLDDGGAARDAIVQAQLDLETAQLELRQKQTSDPTKGLPPTRAEIAAARAAVPAALARLEKLLAPPERADVTAARLDVQRAEADLQALQGGTPEARADALSLAEENVQLAEQRLQKLLTPPNAADVSAAEAEVKKAEADLALLRRPAQGAVSEQIDAAHSAVAAAQQKLADLKADKSATTADIAFAQAEVDKANAELAVLLRPPQTALPEEIASAEQAAATARLKLEKLVAPPDPAEVTAARLEIDRARAELRARQAGPSALSLAAARAAVTAAKARLAKLLGRPAPADVAAARLDVRRAEAELVVLLRRGASASAIDIALSRLKVEGARLRLAIARRARQLLLVRSPSKGTVRALLTVRGAPVDGTTPIAAVADLDRLAVSVGLSEFDESRVRRGLVAVVSVDALGGKKFLGKVTFAALAGADNGGVVTFPVRVSLRHSHGLKPGMNVSVRIIVAEQKGVVALPLEAVSRDDEDRATVKVLNAAGQPALRRVTLGLSNNKIVEIARGVHAGERILLPEAGAEAGGGN